MPFVLKFSESLGGHTTTAYSVDSGKRTLATRFGAKKYRIGKTGRVNFALKKREGNVEHYDVKVVDGDGDVVAAGQCVVERVHKLHDLLEERGF